MVPAVWASAVLPVSNSTSAARKRVAQRPGVGATAPGRRLASLRIAWRPAARTGSVLPGRCVRRLRGSRRRGRSAQGSDELLQVLDLVVGDGHHFLAAQPLDVAAVGV